MSNQEERYLIPFSIGHWATTMPHLLLSFGIGLTVLLYNTCLLTLFPMAISP